MKTDLQLSDDQLRRIRETLTRIRKGLSMMDVRQAEPAHIFHPILPPLEKPNGQ
ncbi:hypothetical protein [Sneathiella chinensis]|uniref:hypothetical protein n=1 Tax=Sneathiella chinensis TaxID=349750 RepID=UPI00146D26CA|nr:hypothetical protein [Sneathiella chinensis]